MFTLLLYLVKFFNPEIFLGVKVLSGFIGTFCVQNYFTMQKIRSMSKFCKITVYFIHGFDNATIINYRMQQKGLYRQVALFLCHYNNIICNISDSYS